MTQTIQLYTQISTRPKAGKTSSLSPRRATKSPQETERATQWARGLGWFSVGLGLTELFAPKQLAHGIGLHGGASLLPWLGLRELISGVGILSQNGASAAWVQSRVAGDVIDLGVLGAAFSSPRNDRTKLSVATAAVLGVTVLDVLCSTGKTRDSLLPQPRRITRSIVIMRPVAELYAFWRKLDNLPRVMSHLASVEERADGVSHWIANAPAGMHIEWQAVVVEDVDRKLSWRSVEPSEIAHRGEVRFEYLGEGRGTQITVQLDYDPPAGPLADKLLKWMGEAPEQQIAKDLRRWKQLVETGEIPTTKGQPSGRRSLVGRVLP